MEKKCQVTITLDENNHMVLDRVNTGFNGFELLGLLEILREDVMEHIKGKKHPQIEHKAKVIINEDKDKKL